MRGERSLQCDGCSCVFAVQAEGIGDSFLAALVFGIAMGKRGIRLGFAASEIARVERQATDGGWLIVRSGPRLADLLAGAEVPAGAPETPTQHYCPSCRAGKEAPIQ